MEPILVNAGFAKPDATWNWTDVQSPFARIYYVVEGSAVTHFSGADHMLKPDMLYLTPPFTLHDDRSDGDFALYYIHFYDEVDNRESVFDKYDFPVGVPALATDRSLLDRLLQINPGRHLHDIDPLNYDTVSSFSGNAALSRNMPSHISMETRGILTLLMSRFMSGAVKRSSGGDTRVIKSLRNIHENMEQCIGVSELAARACITPDHFIRLFRRHTGMTPLDYIHLKKIERAQLMLVTTQLSVKEVALGLSFDNVSYFNRLFKRLTGKTPGQYRQQPGR